MARVTPFWSRGMAFCPACLGPLATDEIEWETCDHCGGEGDDEPVGYDAAQPSPTQESDNG